MDNIKVLGDKIVKTLKTDGPISVLEKSISYLKTEKAKKNYIGKTFKDVLFINGCDYGLLPHPPRYRVQHQIEQLRANNISCDETFFLQLNIEQVRNYRAFIIFRCPYTEEIGKFIKLAQSLNKVVIYDIDDLVIDTKYTDTVKYLDTMSAEERRNYDQGVMKMQRVLKMCDAVITTTERLAKELSLYCPKVFINRNTASEKMIELSEKAYEEKLNKTFERKVVKLGYFSGSITHNDDFKLIRPAVAKLMEKYEEIQLHIVGILDIPKELEKFSDRVIAHPFVNWEKLPKLVAEVDINLAPLEKGIFNEAKSENKWVEAALVRVPTVASDIGAFQKMIENGKTGVLCKNEEEWFSKLEELVTNDNKRVEIGENAYKFCIKNCVTLYTGYALAEFIKEMYHPNIAFVLPALNISGGIMVALEHCRVLKNAGYDVTIIDTDTAENKWCEFQNVKFPVLDSRGYKFEGVFDKAVATMWFTMNFLEDYANIRKRYYLVQGFETDFYEPNSPFRVEANQKYCPNIPVQFLTISKWCEKWLESQFEQHPRYLPNGIHSKNYNPVERDFNGKIRILIEGDCGVSYKNVDESFRITNQLDRDKFEVWYLSYNAKPKDWYIVDKFLHKVPFEEVGKIYQQCHILLKTSILESFSYPPLEMMATGGISIVAPNEGNREYLIDGENCLLYPLGNVQKAIEAINRVCIDSDLRNCIYKNGIKTAKSRDWQVLEQRIVEFYS